MWYIIASIVIFVIVSILSIILTGSEYKEVKE